MYSPVLNLASQKTSGPRTWDFIYFYFYVLCCVSEINIQWIHMTDHSRFLNKNVMTLKTIEIFFFFFWSHFLFSSRLQLHTIYNEASVMSVQFHRTPQRCFNSKNFFFFFFFYSSSSGLNFKTGSELTPDSELRVHEEPYLPSNPMLA